jgi:predicted Zn finger-like uncharacterized protein
MLITTCTHCRSRFRVSPQQLNVKQGQVRCGKCSKVFNGFESLERFPDDDTGARLLAAAEASGRTPDLPQDLQPARDEDALPNLEPVTPQIPIEPPSRPSVPHGQTRRPAPSQLTLEPPPPRKPLPRAWSFGVALLTLVLVLELAFVFRGPIAQRYPVLRQPMQAICAYARCNVPWSREESLLKLEESELLEIPGKPNEIALGARVRNLASVAQEYPFLELTLTDATGQTASRRVLRPTDYLGKPLSGDEVLAAGAEVALQLRIETPRIKATGYELLLFYP